MSQSTENQTPISDAANQSPHFDQFTIVGWSKVFDYLSLRDIIAVSETCKAMQLIGGEYFRKTFHGQSCCFDGCEPSFETSSLKRLDFLRFVDTVQINGQMEDLQQFPHVNKFNSITTLQLCFFCVEQYPNGFENISNDNVECIELYRCCIECDLYDIFLKNCPKLKHLRVDKTYFEPISGGIKSIFDHTYPALQRMQYTRNDENSDLCGFLEQNPGLNCLQIDAEDFWSNRNALELSHTKRRGLDCFVIEIESTAIEGDEFTNVLEAFYEHGFYKKLHLAVYWISDDYDYQPLFDGMQALQQPLDVLHTEIFNENIARLIDLRELHLMELDAEVDVMPLALQLIEIERLWIEGTTNQLQPFLQHSKSLKSVVFELKGRNDGSGLNLAAWNRERGKLQPPGKVSIGVDENLYLTTKWMVKNSELRAIELARKETIREYFEFKHRIVDHT